MIWLVGCPNDREVVSLGLLRRHIRSVLSGKASGIKKHGKYEFHLYKYMEKSMILVCGTTKTGRK